MNILLTGHNGNLGTIFKKLCSNHNITTVSRDQWPEINNMFTSSIDLIIHAAYDLKTDYTVNPDRLINSNIGTTTKLLELAHKYKISRFAFISSCAVYGDTSYAEETQTCLPQTINGITKQLNEELIVAFCNKNKINHHIFRLFNLYGGDDRFSILSKLIESYKTKKAFTLNNNGISQRDFLEVHDAVNIINKVIETDTSSFKINIGTGQSTRIIDVVNTFTERFGDINLEHIESREIEYSRANNTKLKKIVTFKYNDIISYIKSLEI